MEREFITNQKKLAAFVGVTPEHLSAIKSGKGMSNDLATNLARIMKIDEIMFKNRRQTDRKIQLNKAMKAYFMRERQLEAEQLNTTPFSDIEWR